MCVGDMEQDNEHVRLAQQNYDVRTLHSQTKHLGIQATHSW